jgi:hypothetical protein
MLKRSPLSSLPLSKRVTARKYPEEFAWWRASGWEMQAYEAANGDLHLFTATRRRSGSTRLWGTRASAEEVATPELIRHFLTVSLYLHLHPRKGSKSYEATGEVGTDAELAAFVRQQRRKVAKSD